MEMTRELEYRICFARFCAAANLPGKFILSRLLFHSAALIM